MFSGRRRNQDNPTPRWSASATSAPDVDESGCAAEPRRPIARNCGQLFEGPDSSHDRRMMLRKASADDLWLPVATAQHGLISRRQLIGLGLTPSQARTNVTNGRWQRVHPGVYATFTGTLDPLHRVWAALLYAGQDAVACCATSLWLFGLLDKAPGDAARVHSGVTPGRPTSWDTTASQASPRPTGDPGPSSSVAPTDQNRGVTARRVHPTNGGRSRRLDPARDAAATDHAGASDGGIEPPRRPTVAHADP